MGAGDESTFEIQPKTLTIFFGLVTQKIKDKYSTANFSLQDQYNQTGDKNMENHQQGDIVLMYKRILITNLKTNVCESVRRVNVYKR